MFLFISAAIERLQANQPVWAHYPGLYHGQKVQFHGLLRPNGTPHTFTVRVALPNGEPEVKHDIEVTVDRDGEESWILFLQEDLPVPLNNIWLSDDDPTHH